MFFVVLQLVKGRIRKKLTSPTFLNVKMLTHKNWKQLLLIVIMFQFTESNSSIIVVIVEWISRLFSSKYDSWQMKPNKHSHITIVYVSYHSSDWSVITRINNERLCLPTCGMSSAPGLSTSWPQAMAYGPLRSMGQMRRTFYRRPGNRKLFPL